MSTPIDRNFAEKMLQTFDDPQRHGVHFLFNEWWEAAPQSSIDAYVDEFEKIPGHGEFLAERFIADAIDLKDLAKYVPGTLGRAYHDFLVGNNLEKNLAVNYGQLHDYMVRNGSLDRMPDAFKYAIIRGFQQHDILHVLTGYEPTPSGEIALQAFCLAQLRFPYFGMWMSVVTTRMTLLEPKTITPIMDAITDGWQFGRAVKNIQFKKWEARFGEPLTDLRSENGIELAA